MRNEAIGAEVDPSPPAQKVAAKIFFSTRVIDRIDRELKNIIERLQV